MKNKRLQIRNFLIVFVPLVLLISVFFIYVGDTTRTPPKEEKLLQNFNQHRAAFEQLRDMLTADTNVSRIQIRGVSLRKPEFSGYPNEQQLPHDRFTKYQALLKEVGVKTASRSGGNNVEPGLIFYVWNWGCAVSPRYYHIGVCWQNQEPTNQIPTLDGYHGPSEYGSAYRHIDSHWYFWTDL